MRGLALVGLLAGAAASLALAVPSDPLFPEALSSLEAMHVPAAWATTHGAITVAVVDRGVNAVPDLRGALLPGWDTAGHTTDVTDTDRHGTAMASIIAARENGVGSVGVCPRCMVLPVKGPTAEAIRWAVDHRARVVLATIYGDDEAEVQTAVAYAHAHGTVVVIPAGNDNTDAPDRYAASGAIRVAALYHGHELLSSNHGRWVDIAGVTPLIASFQDGSYHVFGKSSTASATVAGVAALVLSANPHLDPAGVRRVLVETVMRVPGLDVASEGIVDAEAAVKEAAASYVPRPRVRF